MRVPRGRLGAARRRHALRRPRSSRTRTASTRSLEALDELDETRGTQGNRVYYLAIPPAVMEATVEQIGQHRSGSRLAPADRREAVRPRRRRAPDELNAHPDASTSTSARSTGSTTTSARRRSRTCSVLRFGNGIFEPIWNRQMVDHVQITVAESLGVEGRAGFYEQAGAIRDIVQNHLLQLVALTAMEPPIDFTADSVRNEKVKVLRAIHTPAPKEVDPGPVRAGLRRGRGGARLPPGGRRRRRLDDRDVRRGEALRRQLALGRHAVLHPHRQAATAPRDDDRDPVQARPASALRARPRGRAPTERAARPHPAGRGRLDDDEREGAGPGHDHPAGAHGLRLRRRLPLAASRRRTSG